MVPSTLPARGESGSLAARDRLRRRVLVAGLGNPIMGDDGVGVHACRAWLAQPPVPRHYIVAEVGTAVYSALHLLEWADDILMIDAMRAGGEPGTLYLAEPHDLAVNPTGISLHDLSLLGLVDVLGLRERQRQRPRRVVVLGVEPESLGVSTELSSAVARAIPAILREARRIVASWRQEGPAS